MYDYTYIIDVRKDINCFEGNSIRFGSSERCIRDMPDRA